MQSSRKLESTFHSLILICSNQSKGSGSGQPPKHELKVTLYSNGFTIDDGEFRSYDAPEN